MKFKPHGYQEFVVKYIVDNPVAFVCLDMGLGKTACSLRAIKELIFDRFDVSKVLVVAPLRVAKNTWPEEIKKWNDFSDLRFSVVVGTEKQRKAALAKDAEVYIINRENLAWLCKYMSQSMNCNFRFDMIVIDELSSFKNHNTQRFKAMMWLRNKAKRAIGLTGTPSSNGLMDLFGEMKVLDFGKRLGRYITHYRNRYFDPDKRNGLQIYSYKPKPGAEEQIYDAISDVMVSMKSCDYLDMPELISNVYKVNLNEDEREKYDELKKEMVLELGGETISAANAAVLSSKLLQLANGSVYADDGYISIHDQKLDALEDILESAGGRPVLVCYWYKHDLERIKERLDKLKVKYATIDSDKNIAAWNAGKLEVGLIHPASAGHGLNLQQGGNTMVWYSLTWSLELYQQCCCRLYRQGQQSSSVVIIHLVVSDSIDEQVMRALQRKDATQNRLIEAVKAQLEV